MAGVGETGDAGVLVWEEDLGEKAEEEEVEEEKAEGGREAAGMVDQEAVEKGWEEMEMGEGWGVVGEARDLGGPCQVAKGGE